MNRNINRLLNFVIMSVVMLSITSCSIPQTVSEEKNSCKESVNLETLKESIIKKYDILPEELENIDFEDFIDTYDLNECNIDEYYVPDLIEMYKERDTDRVDYTYIYNNADGKIEEEDIDNMSVVMWEYHEGNTNKYMVIDIDRNVVYYSMKDFFHSCGEDNKIACLDEDDEIFIKEIIKNSGISYWENTYIGTNSNTTGNLNWAIGIELKSGLCYKYHGSGVLDSNTPDNVESMFMVLLKHFS